MVASVICTVTDPFVNCNEAEGKKVHVTPVGAMAAGQLRFTVAKNAPVGVSVTLVAPPLGFPETALTEAGEGALKLKPPTFTVTGRLCTTGPTDPVATMLKFAVPRKVVSVNLRVKFALPPAPPPGKLTGVVEPAPGQVAPAGAPGHVSVTVPEYPPTGVKVPVNVAVPAGGIV